MRAEVARTTARTDPVTRIFDLCHLEKMPCAQRRAASLRGREYLWSLFCHGAACQNSARHVSQSCWRRRYRARIHKCDSRWPSRSTGGRDHSPIGRDPSTEYCIDRVDRGVNRMIKVADCRYLANQCLALAGRRGISEGRRKALLEMAATWAALPRNLSGLDGAASPAMR